MILTTFIYMLLYYSDISLNQLSNPTKDYLKCFWPWVEGWLYGCVSWRVEGVGLRIGVFIKIKDMYKMTGGQGEVVQGHVSNGDFHWESPNLPVSRVWISLGHEEIGRFRSIVDKMPTFIRVRPLAGLMWFTYCRCLRKHWRCHFLQIELNNWLLHMLQSSIKV